MSIRWMAESTRRDIDRQTLHTVTVYPEGTKKEEIKQEYRLTRRWKLLVREGRSYVYTK